MKMKKNNDLLIISFLIAAAFTLFFEPLTYLQASEGEKNFLMAANKRKIEQLTKENKCLEEAKDHAAVKKCRQETYNDEKKLIQEAHEKRARQKVVELEEKIKKLTEQKAKLMPKTAAVESKVEAKVEAKAEPKTEAKVETKAEVKVEPKAEPKAESKATPAAAATAVTTPAPAVTKDTKDAKETKK